MGSSPSSGRPRQRLLVVTGMSGAGKSTALKALEDLGYEAVDNLPLGLLSRLLQTGEGGEGSARPLAIGVDSRTRAFDPRRFVAQIRALKARGDIELALLFFDCDDATLLQRFSATRRRHPLAPDRPVEDGIAREREIMREVRAAADFVFDTTGQTGHDLKRRLTTRYSLETREALLLSVMSFGFSRGVPRDADLVFDVRFLRNPNYVPELKERTGKDEQVALYVAGDPNFPSFFERLKDLVLFLLPLYREEGKSYLTIAFGCTGGQHRSVFSAELMGRVLAEHGYRASIIHRDIAGGPSRVGES
ncbi:MAG: RNase adapter RapZ [Rhodothalassiaceae bacterium]